MTREEAYTLLEVMAINIVGELTTVENPVLAKQLEAIDMAQKALSADAEQGVGRYENAMQKLREMPRYLNGVKEKQITKISADAVQGEWIPCSERLPKAEDMYQPPEQRYLCQLEAHGVRKFCVLSRLKGAVSPFWDWYGVAVHDSEVTAWMPLPTPYKGGEDE